MIWRKLANVTGLGTSPPPYRPNYPDAGGNALKVWTRVRTIVYFNGAVQTDSDWSAWVNGFAYPAGGQASKNGTNTTRSDVMIETAGRYMPWQVVVEDKTTILSTGITSLSTYVVDMAPGTVTTFPYDASTGRSVVFNRFMINIPAEGA